MDDYVIMPKADYKGMCDKVRAQTGSTEVLKSGELLLALDSVIGSGGSSDLVKYVTFMSADGTTELFKMPVLSGDDCKDPIEHGDIETPTQESTNTTNYTYSGWSATIGGSVDSTVLQSITEDKIVYVAFEESTRYYTVNFYDEENLLHTELLIYGATSDYEYTKEGYSFNGWTPTPTNITSDMNCYGTWTESVKFDDLSWEQIAQYSADGTASQMFKVGDKKTIELSTGVTMDVVIIGFNHDDLADGSGKAGITLAYDSVFESCSLGTGDVASVGNENWGTFGGDIFTRLNRHMSTKLPSDLTAVIKPVIKKYYSQPDDAILTSEHSLWLFAYKELGYKSVGLVFEGEGEKYDYFTGEKDSLTAYEELIRYDTDGTAREWWLRTKFIQSYYGNSVESTGKFGSDRFSASRYILAGFCI